jgi:hypothetical protein
VSSTVHTTPALGTYHCWQRSNTHVHAVGQDQVHAASPCHAPHVHRKQQAQHPQPDHYLLICAQPLLCCWAELQPCTMSGRPHIFKLLCCTATAPAVQCWLWCSCIDPAGWTCPAASPHTHTCCSLLCTSPFSPCSAQSSPASVNTLWGVATTRASPRAPPEMGAYL